jgi:hypothetical protein
MGKRSQRRSVGELTAFARQMNTDLRRLSERLRAAKAGGVARSSDEGAQLAESLQEVAAAFQELRELIPAKVFTTSGIESRLLCLGLVAQWLGNDAEAGDDEPATALHGNTGTIAISALIEFLGLHKKSGLLRVESAAEDFLLEFESGDIVHVESSRAPRGERLGDYLVARSAISEEELERAIGRYQRSRLTLGQILSRENLISNDDLRAALRAQMQALFARLVACTDARFRFEESSGRGAMERVRMSTTQLLLETARVTDERARDAGARRPPAEEPAAAGPVAAR